MINIKKSILVLLVLIIIYILLTLSRTAFWGDNSISEKKTIITGHRGAAGLAPENTLAAIQVALDYKTDRIEIDIQQTKDNKVIVMHDITIDRTTTGAGFVKNLSFDEIRKFNAAEKFNSKFKDEKVPSLEEVLQLINGKSVLLIEIKDGNEYYPNIEQNTIDLINKYKAKDWCIIQSFNDKALFKAHEIAPDFTYHKLFITSFPFTPFFYDTGFNSTAFEKYDFVSEFSLNVKFATQRIINKIHSLNKKVNVWTIRDSIQGNRLINYGVDGIITDYPNYFLENK